MDGSHLDWSRPTSDDRCRYCQQVFNISRYRPHQLVCSRPDCQKQRRREYHRHKLHTDPEHHEICRDSQEKWRRRNPDYPRQYRQSHPESIERNRQGQRRRDRKRHLQNLVKNNLAFDLKHSAAEVWLLGPEAENLAKNNLAFSQVLILRQFLRPGSSGGILKRTCLWCDLLACLTTDPC